MNDPLVIFLDHACNNHCTFCRLSTAAPDPSTPEKRPRPMDIAELTEYTVDSSSSRERTIVLTGSEPTLLPGLAELIQDVRALGHRGEFVIETNARMLSYPELAEALCKDERTRFSISLHGATPRTHDSVTRVPGSFEQTFSGLKNLRKNNADFDIRCSIDEANLPELVKIADLAAESGCKSLTFELHLSSSTRPNLDRAVDAVRPAVERCLDLHGMSPKISGIPYCLVPGLEACVVRSRVPPFPAVRKPGHVRSGTHALQEVRCSNCNLFRKCMESFDIEALTDEELNQLCPLTEMSFLFIPVSGPCDNRCSFCCKGDTGGKPEEPVTGILKDVSALSPPRSFCVLVGGTEPLAHSGLFTLLEGLQKQGFESFELQTTARSLYKHNVAKQLKALGVRAVRTPLYGVTPGVHDSITRVEGSFEQTLQGIYTAMDEGILVWPTSLLLVQNKSQWLDIETFCMEKFGSTVDYYVPFPDTPDGDNYRACAPRFSDIPEAIMAKLQVDIPCISPTVCEARPWSTQLSFKRKVFRLYPPRSRSKRIKPVKCKSCAMHRQCAGIWPEYIELYGTGEFVPISTARKTIPANQRMRSNNAEK